MFQNIYIFRNLIALFIVCCFGFAQIVSAEEEVLTPEEIVAQEEEEKEKEEEQDELEDKENKLEKEIKKEQEKLDRYQNDLGVVNRSYNATLYSVSETQKEITEKEQDIDRHEKQVSSYEQQINLKEDVLASVFRELYFQKRSLVDTRIIEDDTASFFAFRDRLNVIRTKATAIITDIKNKKNDTLTAKAEIAQTKGEKEELLTVQNEQKQVLAVQKAQVQGKVENKQADVAQLNAKLAAVQSDLSSLLGESVSTDDIVEAASFASKKTGVRKGFILGMLIVETDLGRYTGGCTYKESRMNDHRKDLFKKIAKDLGYNYKKLKVSCPPSNYKGTGGAMGVAQFMSDTWMGYKSKIASKTGNNPPDPWSLTDGVMAMALKLANDGGASKSGEWNAAARYLGSCSGNTRFYCENVLYWADNYKKKL